jgi:hypothetical protein
MASAGSGDFDLVGVSPGNPERKGLPFQARERPRKQADPTVYRNSVSMLFGRTTRYFKEISALALGRAISARASESWFFKELTERKCGSYEGWAVVCIYIYPCG